MVSDFVRPESRWMSVCQVFNEYSSYFASFAFSKGRRQEEKPTHRCLCWQGSDVWASQQRLHKKTMRRVLYMRKKRETGSTCISQKNLGYGEFASRIRVVDQGRQWASQNRKILKDEHRGGNMVFWVVYCRSARFVILETGCMSWDREIDAASRMRELDTL